MKRDLPALANIAYDVLVIGGGILGAGIARDAALRGLRVALVDKNDFASGTSSRSTKLIHGGFRYLEQYAFNLVAESCRERHLLQQLAPERVRPLPLLLPVYDGDVRPLWQIRLGMTLYDLLARYRNTARHKLVPPPAGLRQDGLRGVVQFYDSQVNDARFCVDNLRHAADLGAVCANYCEVTGFRTGAAKVRDAISNVECEIPARFFVNAAGPWVPQLAELAGQRVPLSPTKGVHLLLPRVTAGHGIFFQARSDGRLLFVLPWGDCSLVGTTDTDFSGDPTTARVEPADVDYLLRELRWILPDAPTDIITTFAGVRALLGNNRAPSARTREHRIVRHNDHFLSIVGGKYTTYRLIAQQVVDQLTHRPCRTGTTPIPAYPVSVETACREEMALTLDDVMWRRTGWALSQAGGREKAEEVAEIMARELGWDNDRTAAEVARYLKGRTWHS